MRVKVKDGYRPTVDLVQGPQGGKGNGMIAT